MCFNQTLTLKTKTMRQPLTHYSKLILAGLLPISETSEDDVSKESKTYKKFEKRKPDNETGVDRLKAMFQLESEFHTISPELNSIYQGGFVGFLIGAVYGGVIQSREGYMRFMENNEATAFESHLDAKRKLQDQFTINFAKGGLKWGWRLGLFTTSYLGIVTCISVYRNKSSIFEYLAAGGLTGALYKVNMGLRGMAVGGIVGGILGGVAGASSLLIMKASGTSMEEVRYWQYKWRTDRDDDIKEAVKIQLEKTERSAEIIKHHEQKKGHKTTLEEI
ncbi:RPII140-upstream gene protein [Teleopsis dalmanni]|uniref:RPII140-upstream gene protein n=1 Tax=Teleopsis dalmanni TaxID=139649 RepID=UPI0018CFA9BB|nr:RPII140-upstream gene protein [Teleopsis dalmanni]